VYDGGGSCLGGVKIKIKTEAKNSKPPNKIVKIYIAYI